MEAVWSQEHTQMSFYILQTIAVIAVPQGVVQLGSTLMVFFSFIQLNVSEEHHVCVARDTECLVKDTPVSMQSFCSCLSLLFKM